MIIDSHQHVLKDIEEQRQLNLKSGIDKVVLFPTIVHPEVASNFRELVLELGTLRKVLNGEINPIEARIKSIEELVIAIKKFPELFIGFASCPLGLNYNETGDWIEKLIIQNNLHGIGELTFGPGNASLAENIFKYLYDSKKALPIWIHTFNPLAYEDIREIVRLSEKYSSVDLILGHGGGSFWLETLEIVKQKRNIYIDLSATFTTLSIQYFAKEIPDRCLFSSDLPYGDPYLGVQQMKYIVKDTEVLNNILGNNINRLLSK